MKQKLTGMGRLQVGDELLLEVSDLLGLDGIQVTTDTSVDDANLLSDWHGLVLVLFQQFGQTGTTGKELKIIVIAFKSICRENSMKLGKL